MHRTALATPQLVFDDGFHRCESCSGRDQDRRLDRFRIEGEFAVRQFHSHGAALLDRREYTIGERSAGHTSDVELHAITLLRWIGHRVVSASTPLHQYF